MSGFKPVHAAHAIERVSTGIQFAQPLSETDFKEIRELASAFSDDLPRQVEIQAMMLAIGPPGGSPEPPFPGGFLLQNMERDGSVSSELRIETASVTYRTDTYTRWHDVWSKAKKYFDILIPKFLSYSEVVSINLTYVDKFVWDGELSECQPKLLLRNKSEYICSHVYNSGELWHSHTGKFLRVEDKFKRLLNLNIDCLDEKEASGNDQRVVKILTVVTDNINQPGYKTVEIKSDTVVDFIDEHMRELHIFSKNTFGKIICDEMCKRIGLLE
jgi:uncharacterized protein (TIGR04255 family)